MNNLAVTNKLPLTENKNFEFKPTGLEIKGSPTYDEWESFGNGLKAVNGAVQWWIGDWINYGESAYGEKYSQALEATDYEYETLKGYSYTARMVEKVRRRTNLLFSHHREVAKLKPKEQEKWLKKAEEEQLSVRKLRDSIRGKILKEEKLNLPEEYIACPKCGHQFEISEGRR